MRARRALAGFTVVELMIALAVVSILAGLAVPMFSDAVAARRVQSVAQSLAATLQTAQTEAIRRNRAIEVAFTTATPTAANAATATAVSASSARGWIARVVNASATTDFVAGQALTGDFSAITLTQSIKSIAYTPMARVLDMSAGSSAPVTLGSPVTIRVSTAGSARKMCVTVMNGGSVRICDPSVSYATGTACQAALADAPC
ncbi:MAG: GspH/FimT family pseudopilin [Burkholderiaceae bacterium]|jgi:type IV fimbrial biogenesis protein FimT